MVRKAAKEEPSFLDREEAPEVRENVPVDMSKVMTLSTRDGRVL